MQLYSGLRFAFFFLTATATIIDSITQMRDTSIKPPAPTIAARVQISLFAMVVISGLVVVSITVEIVDVIQLPF